MAIEDIFDSLIQPVPGDETTLQKYLRVLSVPKTPRLFSVGDVVDLSEGPLCHTTDIEEPFQLSVVALNFQRVVDGVSIPDVSPKDFGFYLVLRGHEYALTEMRGWVGTSVTLTDPIKLSSGDQVRVKASGFGVARFEIRGEML